MEQFFCRTHIVSGQRAGLYLAGMGIRRLLIVTDPFFYKNGTAQAISRDVSAEAVNIFHKVTPDPSVTLAAEGAALVRQFRPDTIVALGGGSAMDCAKAMAYFSGHDAKLVAIPTTSGSGSEVTDFAILTHDGVKHPLVDPTLRPEVAILDPSLVAELPPALIADGGFDALTHALEAYTAQGAGIISDSLAIHSFQQGYGLLKRSYDGDAEARTAMHTVATTAGMAFSAAGLGLCHAMSHSLGGALHLPHGRLNAILLPAVIKANAPAAGEKYALLAQAIGLESRSVTLGIRNLLGALTRLRRELNLPSDLAQAGVSVATLRPLTDGILQAALNDPCCTTNPLPVTPEIVRTVLREVSGHG